jgi:hypothetical protein
LIVDRTIASGVAVLVIAATHIFFPAFDKATAKHRRLLLPFTAGIAIGYVFLYLLPKLSDYTALIIKESAFGWEFLHYRLYLLALVGFLVYLAIDRLSLPEHPYAKRVRLIQGAGFCFYNVLIGYIVFSLPRPGILPYLLGTFAICAHFIGIDHQLRRWQEAAYDRYLRWLIAASVLAGWGISLFFELPKEFLMSATALLSGGIIINVMTEELPDKREGRLAPFLAGVVFFLLMVIIMRSLPRLPI